MVGSRFTTPHRDFQSIPILSKSSVGTGGQISRLVTSSRSKTLVFCLEKEGQFPLSAGWRGI